MTVPAGTTQTYQQVGVREQLSNMIYNIDPVDTPFMTMIKVGKRARSTSPEWQIESLPNAAAQAGVIEGDDVAATTNTYTTRLRNYTQLVHEVTAVSTTAQAVEAAGREELNHQMNLRAKEIKRNLETLLTGNNASVAGAAGTARELGGYETWIETNTSRGTADGLTDGANGGYSLTNNVTVAATDASASNLRAFTEGLLKAVILSCWENGGDPRDVIVGGFNKQVASGFSGIAAARVQLPAGGVDPSGLAIQGGADLYRSDFGLHRITPDRFVRGRSALVVDKNYWEICYLQPFRVVPLAKTGHNDKRMLTAELTLKCLNESASGIVADLTSS